MFFTMQIKTHLAYSFLLLLAVNLTAGDFPKKLPAPGGKTPVLDGIIAEGEYNDASMFFGTASWSHEQSTPTDSNDLSVIGYVKHDSLNLYFAFDVTDDVVYGIDIERWLPDGRPLAHELNQSGMPWFGDGIEIMLNASNNWSTSDGEICHGDGTSWQMVCSSHKSRLDSLNGGGLMEGEPRSVNEVYNRYQKWILDSSMMAVVRIKDKQTEGSGYVIEWLIKPDPCLEVSPGTFWNVNMDTTDMGMNIELQDLDEKEKGAGNWCNFHHIEHWAAPVGQKTWLKSWGTLTLVPFQQDTSTIEPNAIPFTAGKFPEIHLKGNPLSDDSSIEIITRRNAVFRIEIFDVTGRKVQHIFNNTLTEGIHEISLSNTYSQLPEGIYLLHVNSGKINHVIRFIK